MKQRKIKKVSRKPRPRRDDAADVSAEPTLDEPAAGHLPFPDLGLSPELLKAVGQLGFEEASPIQ